MDEHQPGAAAPMRGSTHSFFGRKLFVEPDLEKGASFDHFGTPAASSLVYPQWYPRLAKLLDSEASFMLCRRFGTLHALALKRREQELQGFDNIVLRENKRPETLSQYRAQEWLLSQIDVKLSAYGESYRRS